MSGVYTPWSSVHDTVIAEVKSLVSRYPDYTLESTGHSLGGSLTYLSYIALAQNFPGKSLTSNALAAFPIGNSVFANFGSAQTGLLRRGNNAGDGVPVSYSLHLCQCGFTDEIVLQNMYVPMFTHYGTVCSSKVSINGQANTKPWRNVGVLRLWNCTEHCQMQR